MRSVSSDRTSRTIVESIRGLSENLGIDCVVEGVETLEQVGILQEIGCPKMQGYFFGRPMDAPAILARLTALMTLVEGHGDYVMDAVGPQVVPSVAEIRKKFNTRRRTAGRVEQTVRRLLGIDLKMKQYAEGSRFVRMVVDAIGMEGFNKVWESPDTIPTMAEIADPSVWIARVASGYPTRTALTAPAGANGLLFHSFLASQVTPYYDAASRGGWLGLGLYHTRSDMIRALLEGCAHEMRMVVDSFQSDIKGGITDLRLTGGGTKSDGFAQIMTDIIGQPTKVTRERECTVFRPAILGALGSGSFSSIDEAVGAMVTVDGDSEPNGDTKELYEEANGVYRGMYEAIAQGGQYQKLSDFSNRYF